MTRRLSQWIVFVALLLVSMQIASADSIWGRANHRSTSIYADDSAKAVGDILTISIEERSVVDNETNRKLAKSSNRDVSMDGTADMRDMFSPLSGSDAFEFPQISYSSENKQAFDGQAVYDTERTIADQITVVVEDVLPNGNLVVLGSRYRSVDGEELEVQISGIVRPSDINFSNSIESSRVADFRLVMKMHGSDQNSVRVGWFNRFVNWANPF